MAAKGTALVTGATGMLGRDVMKAFERAGWKAIGTGLSRAQPPKILKLDLQNSDEIVKILDEVKPDVVVHCAADRSPDSCAANPSLARTINALAPSTIASHTSSRGILLIYISTDYVFSGLPGEAPYSPSSPTAPPNAYGQTKLEGEQGVLAATAKATQNAGDGHTLSVVLRVPVLYGRADESDASKSSVHGVLDGVYKTQDVPAGGAKIKMDDYALRYPTATEDVGRVCVDVAKVYTQTEKKGLPSILHFSARERMTKYQMSEVFADILGFSVENLERFDPSKGEGEGVKRPYDTCLLGGTELQDLGVDSSCCEFKGWWRRELRAFRH